MSSSSARTTGITARDLSTLQAQIEQEHYGNVVVELRTLPSRSTEFVRYSVVVANYVGTHRTPRNTRAVVSGTFPSNKWKTLNGCVFNLLHMLYGELEKLRDQHRGAATPLEQAIQEASHYR